MDYKLSTKNKNGKWWTYGIIKTSPKGHNQASFKVSALKELIELAGDKEWVNLSLFDNVPKPISSHSEAEGNAFAPDLSDEIIF
jgi:hypothetical protein